MFVFRNSFIKENKIFFQTTQGTAVMKHITVSLFVIRHYKSECTSVINDTLN